jgi:hypothetical protein
MADLRHFFGHVAGESYRNADGSDRQRIIPRCRVGELLVLKHEPDNPHDINAIRVLRQSGEQIGYLERELAGQVVSREAKGEQYHAAIAGIGRARAGVGPWGVALLIIVDGAGAATDATLRRYAREVLEDEGHFEQEHRRAEPAQTTGGWEWWMLPAAVVVAAVGAVIILAVMALLGGL